MGPRSSVTDVGRGLRRWSRAGLEYPDRPNPICLRLPRCAHGARPHRQLPDERLHAVHPRPSPQPTKGHRWQTFAAGRTARPIRVEHCAFAAVPRPASAVEGRRAREALVIAARRLSGGGNGIHGDDGRRVANAASRPFVGFRAWSPVSTAQGRFQTSESARQAVKPSSISRFATGRLAGEDRDASRPRLSTNASGRVWRWSGRGRASR